MALSSSRHKRVFLLGAGVSASCGIAVAQTILRECLADLSQKNADQVNKVHGLISYLYPSFEAGFRNYPNIEDFLNLLQMARTFNSEDFIKSSVWPDSKLVEVQNITLKALADYLWKKTIEGPPSAALEFFAKEHLKNADTVISFNWDICLEKALVTRYGNFSIETYYSRKRRTKAFRHSQTAWVNTLVSRERAA
jgi:hypothetical protein